MKKVFVLMLMIVSVVSLAACGSSGSSGTAGNTGNTVNTGSTGAPVSNGDEVLHITFGEVLAAEHPLAQGSYRFKELVEEKSGGSIVVDIFPSQQLGSLRELVEQTQMGVIQITRGIMATLSGFVPELEVLEYPYLLPTTEEEIWAMMDGEIGEKIFSTFEDYDLYALGFWPQGFKHITANSPILTPEDMRGTDMRVSPSNILIQQYKAWGANPIAIDFAELYTSLQQGTVDAQENPVDSILSMRLYEVQDYMMSFNHSYQLNMLVMNESWFKSLTEEQQQIIQEAHDEATAEYRATYMEKSEEIVQQLIDNGMTIQTLSEEQIEAFRSLSEPLYDTLITSDKQRELLELILADE